MKKKIKKDMILHVAPYAYFLTFPTLPLSLFARGTAFTPEHGAPRTVTDAHASERSNN